ncbi:Uncharacterised protein [uncultured Comamonas sp.]|nr:Uncharacterised protein [uncultured Comamonas sp.]
MTYDEICSSAWAFQADEHNQWGELGEDEKLEWAFACGTSAVPAHPTRQELEAVLSAMGEEGNPVKPADIPSATDQDTHFFLAGWNCRAAAPNAPLYDPRDVAFSAQAAPIQQTYTLAEIKAKIASHDYNAELLLQHALLLLEQVVDHDGNEHTNFSTDCGFAGVLNEAIDAANATQAAKQGKQ